jgi:uncharacterized protein YbjT (DUF2867 family)
MQILVIGATGALGRPLVRALRGRGVAVRAASRHPAQAADLAALGAHVLHADLTDRSSLQQACQGADRVLMAAHGMLGRGRWRSEAVDDAGVRALVDVARDAGVQRFVYCSLLGARLDHPVDFMATKARLEQVVRTSGLPFAILRPSAFMEHHAHNFNGKGLLDKGKAQQIGPGIKPRNFVAATDVARLTERALLDDPLPFTTLDIGGHGHYSNLDVAGLYAREAGIPLKVGHLPRGAARTLALLATPLHPGVARILRLSAMPDDAFEERFDGAAELEQRFGIQLLRMEDFVRQQVTAWRAARPAP